MRRAIAMLLLAACGGEQPTATVREVVVRAAEPQASDPGPPQPSLTIDGVVVRAAGLPAISEDGSTLAFLSRREASAIAFGATTSLYALFELDLVATESGARERIELVPLRAHTIHLDAVDEVCPGDDFECDAADALAAERRGPMLAELRASVETAQARLAQGRWRPLDPLERSSVELTFGEPDGESGEPTGEATVIVRQGDRSLRCTPTLNVAELSGPSEPRLEGAWQDRGHGIVAVVLSRFHAPSGEEQVLEHRLCR
jgi:hypothetical protein